MTPSESPIALLQRSAKLNLFVMLRRTLNPARQREHLAEHLRWMIGEEKAGHIFLSGPIAPREDSTTLDGLTIIRVASLAEAETLAKSDPFVALGVVACEIREWTVNEGAIPLTVTLSDSTVTFG